MADRKNMTDLDRRKNYNTSKRYAGRRWFSQQDERIAQSPGNDPDRRAARAFEYLLQLSPLWNAVPWLPRRARGPGPAKGKGRSTNV